jgi:hypothetical protein
MDGACTTYRGEERCIQDFGGETGGKETIWKSQARIILRRISKKLDGEHGLD